MPNPTSKDLLDSELDKILDEFYEAAKDIDVDYGSVQKHEVKNEIFNEAKQALAQLIEGKQREARIEAIKSYKKVNNLQESAIRAGLKALQDKKL